MNPSVRVLGMPPFAFTVHCDEDFGNHTPMVKTQSEHGYASLSGSTSRMLSKNCEISRLEVEVWEAFKVAFTELSEKIELALARFPIKPHVDVTATRLMEERHVLDKIVQDFEAAIIRYTQRMRTIGMPGSVRLVTPDYDGEFAPMDSACGARIYRLMRLRENILAAQHVVRCSKDAVYIIELARAMLDMLLAILGLYQNEA